MANRKIRPIRIEGNDAFITLTGGHVAVIDVADLHIVDRWNWTAAVSYRRDGSVRTIYAKRGNRTDSGVGVLRLHRAIAGAPADMQVDHIDGDGLNNRRSNLRLATGSENVRNRRVNINSKSGLKGASWCSASQKWRAQIRLNGKNHHIGTYSRPEEASAAYAVASERMHGSFGKPTG